MTEEEKQSKSLWLKNRPKQLLKLLIWDTFRIFCGWTFKYNFYVIKSATAIDVGKRLKAPSSLPETLNITGFLPLATR